ncbi:enoyl-CoA hydratase/isomerase family protein [Nocardia transvalensis]|uniref:enoyl-CoA hydratase/isomerase family protein n=1 Tax=Nocardia transvalensis TaxID=37333 RepID=UPI00189324C9|nr:enoyl-CoA hydratase/isomerase family protein [Nocardia transvalensis]MBF6330733.1 enoyl-CoA hydratase/isomerase family protein [Nocardia transvalensis]
MPDPRHTESPFEFLRYEERGPVARITLNRPEVRNALSIALSAELAEAIALVQESTAVKVLVISGAGETFCAGDDLVEFAAGLDAGTDLNEVLRTVRRYQATANALEELDKITIAAVDGYAVGGGLEITMACDFVVATERARWGMPEIDVGITPGWGGTTRMSRLIGRRLTKEVNMLGALHPAARARELGLWNRVVADDRLTAEVDALVEVLLSKNQQMLRQLKFIINRGVETDLYSAQGFEALSVGITSAVNGNWRAADSDEGAGLRNFAAKGELWNRRRGLARDFWVERASPLTPH